MKSRMPLRRARLDLRGAWVGDHPGLPGLFPSLCQAVGLLDTALGNAVAWRPAEWDQRVPARQASAALRGPDRGGAGGLRQVAQRT